MDKINEQTMFDATVDVKYEESGWPKRLAHHQKILKPVHYGQDENPPLTLFRLNTSRLKSNHNAPVSSSKETLNGEEDDLVLGNLKAKKITATSRQPKNNRQTLNSITWTPWQAYLKSIDGKVKEFLKSHDKRAVELTDALEKMSLRRADIFHETWAIVDEILQEKIDGDIGTKVQNEIHQRRDARNKELTGLIREWNVMKERMKAESDKALEFDENIWKLMRG